MSVWWLRLWVALIVGATALAILLVAVRDTQAHVPPPASDVGFRYDGCPGTFAGANGCLERVGLTLIVHVDGPEQRYTEQGYVFADDLSQSEKGRWLDTYEKGKPWSPDRAKRFSDKYAGCALHEKADKKACNLFWKFADTDTTPTTVDPFPEITTLRGLARQWRDEAFKLRGQVTTLCAPRAVECVALGIR